MITGFNTDIEYEGVTYHVQTEDKGVDTPLILSLVYNRGTILASKRSPYNDLLIGSFNEQDLKERLHRQHKLMCAAVKAGRIDDLKRMTMKESASKKEGLIAQKEIKLAERVAPPIAKPGPPPVPKPAMPLPEVEPPRTVESIIRREDVPAPKILSGDGEAPKDVVRPTLSLPSDTESALQTERELQALEEVWDIPISIIEDEDVFVDEVEIIEEVTILPSEAVEILTDFARQDEPVDEGMTVELLNDITFRGGESSTVSVLVSRDRGRTNLVGVSVMVKVLGSAFRPLIFHAKSDSNGVAIIQLQLPSFARGRAAVLIKAVSGSEEAELRRVVLPDGH